MNPSLSDSAVKNDSGNIDKLLLSCQSRWSSQSYGKNWPLVELTHWLKQDRW